MPLTVSQVLGSRPESLTAAAADVKAAGAEIDVQMAGERSQMDALALKWSGTASDGAQVNATEMIGDQQGMGGVNPLEEDAGLSDGGYH
ncbi:hypothetical protein AB0876_14170 [Mycobacterium sp. NPDC049093]